MARWTDEEATEGKRTVEIRIDNAVFSKLIKLGREAGRTPQRQAQALFEEAYVEACMGKTAKGQAAPPAAADDAREAHEDFRKVAALAEEWQAKHANAQAEAAELRAQSASANDGRERALAKWKACQDQLVAAQAEAAELRQLLDQANAAYGKAVDKARRMDERRLAAEADLAQLRAERAADAFTVVGPAPPPLQIVPAEVPHHALPPAWLDKRGVIDLPKPASAVEISPAEIRLIRNFRAAGASPREIARELILPVAIVREALAGTKRL